MQRLCPKDGFQTVDELDLEDPLVGTIFDERYRIDEVIGRGGMGAVYRATQLAVNRPVGLKVMRTDMVSDLKAIARFQQEARAIAALTHPNTIRLIDFGHAQGNQLFLVMEYLQGESLGALLSREGPLSAERLVTLTTQILESLSEAHAQGMVHRDMKPDNVFLTHVHGRKDFIKVLDFGIAKLTGTVFGESPQTSTGIALGSPRYMAPEQACAQPATAQADIYAVGVMMYQMLTGAVPFSGDNVRSVILAHIRQPPPPPRKDGVLLDGGLVQLIMRCLAKQPSDRPAGAELVIEQLQKWGRDPTEGVFAAQSQPSLLDATLPLQVASDATHAAPDDGVLSPEPARATSELSHDGVGQTLALKTPDPDDSDAVLKLRGTSGQGAQQAPRALHTPGNGLMAEKEAILHTGTQRAWLRQMAAKAVAALLLVGVAGFVYQQWVAGEEGTAVQGDSPPVAMDSMPILRIAPKADKTTARASQSQGISSSVSRSGPEIVPDTRPTVIDGTVASAFAKPESAGTGASLNLPSIEMVQEVSHEIRVVTTPSGAKVLLEDKELGVTPLSVRWSGAAQGRRLNVSLKAHQNESVLLSTLVGRKKIQLNLKADGQRVTRKPKRKASRRSAPKANTYEALP